MTAYELPTSLNISGVDFSIRTDFRAIIDILIAQNDPELDEQAKAVVMLQILFEDWQSIPSEHLAEACQKACEFIDCGQSDTNPNKPKPRLMDWEQDGDMIVPAVNKVTGKEIRAVPYMHWWKFQMLIDGMNEDCELKKRMGYRSIDLSKIKDKEERERIRKIQKQIAIVDRVVTSEEIGDAFGNMMF